MGKEKLVIPSFLAIGTLAYIFMTPPSFDMQGYALGFAIAFAFAFKSMTDDTDKYFVLVGYLLWNMAYVWQIYYGYQEKLSTWPLFSGSYYVVNEFLTCCTTYFETPNQEKDRYVTPTYVKVGYYFYLSLDFILNMMTIYFGTGSDYDELGLFPMKTMEQRALGFVCWCTFWAFTQINLVNAFGPRQAKYSMAGFHYVCHASSVRLPIFRNLHSHIGMANILKLQTYGSAYYIVRIKAPCDPQILFRILLVFVAPFCAMATTSWFEPLVALETSTFGMLVLAWEVGFWIALTLLNKYNQFKMVSPEATTSADKKIVSGKSKQKAF